MLEFIDTHCHLQFPQYRLDVEDVIKRSFDSGVNSLITVGTTASDSQDAIKLAESYDNIWASVGLHPHDASNLQEQQAQLQKLVTHKKVVAVGECGLDYYRNLSPKAEQIKAFKFQIELAIKHNLPLIFHIRDAYDDFWSIVNEYHIAKAVVHCFSADQVELNKILQKGWYIGLNGIVTFSQNTKQLQAFKMVSLDKLLLETDAPYLTPAPLRGKINEPKNVEKVAEFLSKLKGEPLDKLAKISTVNARQLFGI